MIDADLSKGNDWSSISPKLINRTERHVRSLGRDCNLTYNIDATEVFILDLETGAKSTGFLDEDGRFNVTSHKNGKWPWELKHA